MFEKANRFLVLTKKNNGKSFTYFSNLIRFFSRVTGMVWDQAPTGPLLSISSILTYLLSRC